MLPSSVLPQSPTTMVDTLKPHSEAVEGRGCGDADVVSRGPPVEGREFPEGRARTCKKFGG